MQRLNSLIRVRLAGEQRAELDRLAELDRRSVSYLTRVAVDEYLERRRTDLRRPRTAAAKGA